MGNGTTNTQTTNPAQEKVAKTVSTIVLTGTCLFGVLGMSIAIVAISKGEFENSKDILQILLSTILPLFGTWIGTILAFYFSKENLAAANRTVEHLVNSITSDKKLESIKARDVMIPVEELKYISYPTGTDDTTINLKTNFLDFISKEKISRVILLDEKKCAKYVLHKSIIEGFIAEQYFLKSDEEQEDSDKKETEEKDKQTDAAGGSPLGNAGTTSEDDTTPKEPSANKSTSAKAPRTLTFADMKLKGNENVQAILKDGVKFIKEDANLSDAKILIKNYSACNDVFITKNGTADEPVLGWITDKTIAEKSIV